MIIALTAIALAFIWLLWETKGLTIRLESHSYQQANMAKNKVAVPATIQESQESTKPYAITEFIQTELPEYKGALNIICERGQQ